MALNLTMTSYMNKKRSEFRIIGQENYGTGIEDNSTHAPTGDSVNSSNGIYFIFVIYLCITLVILVWLGRRRWNAQTESRQEEECIDINANNYLKSSIYLRLRFSNTS